MVVCTAELVEVDGRKVWMKATVVDSKSRIVYASGKALFVTPKIKVGFPANIDSEMADCITETIGCYPRACSFTSHGRCLHGARRSRCSMDHEDRRGAHVELGLAR